MRLDELWDLFTNGKNRLALGAWYTAVGGETPDFFGDDCYENCVAPKVADAVYGGLFSFAYLQEGRVTMLGSAMGGREAIEQVTDAVGVGIGGNHMLIAHKDGTVTGYGSALSDKLNVEEWNGITAVSAGLQHSVGLMADGTVTAVGDNSFMQCEVGAWSQVTAISSGLNHTVGLKADGRVYACGDNTYGQCEVDSWNGIIAVSCGANYTLGLKQDFTVVAVGDNRDGQCDVDKWTDVVEICAGVWHTVARNADGELLYCGTNANGQQGGDATLLPVSEYVYGVDSEGGPWCYVSELNGVMICYDTSDERVPIRADLFATKGNMPYGAFANNNATAGERIMPARIARQSDVVFAQTSDFIGFRPNAKGVMIRNGEVYYDRTDTSSMAFFPDGTMRVYEKKGDQTAAQMLEAGVANSYAFGPILVKDNEVHQETLDRKKHSPCPRCAIGMIEPYHYVSIVTSVNGPMTLGWLAEQFVEYGCQVAYNLDGGNSSAMVFMGEQINLLKYNYNDDVGMRALSDVLAFGSSSAVPDEDEPYHRQNVIK